MEREELGRLANASVVVLAEAMSGNPRSVLSPQAADVLIAVPALVDELHRLRTALLTIADDTNDIATYWAICDLIGEEPPSPEPRPRPADR